MKLQNTRGQTTPYDYLFDASQVVTGGTTTLLLPVSRGRLMLILQYVSAASTDYAAVNFGGARATATIADGAIDTISVTNGGFNYTIPPQVRFIGGGNQLSPGSKAGNPNFVSGPFPGFPTPADQPRAHAVLTTGVVTSIVVDYPGSGFVAPPMVFLENDPNDPFGAVDPAIDAIGIYLPGGQTNTPIILNGTGCPTDAVSVIASADGLLLCKYMTC